LAHKFKEGDPDAIDIMAEEMAHRIPDDATLIPVPSRSGIATDTKVLAERIRDIRGGSVRVEDIVVGKERKSLYDLKKSKAPIPDNLFGFSVNKVPQGNVYLVDNVYNTGATAKEIQKLLPHAQVLVYAYSEPQLAASMNWYKKANKEFQRGDPVKVTQTGDPYPYTQRTDLEEVHYFIDSNEDEDEVKAESQIIYWLSKYPPTFNQGRGDSHKFPKSSYTIERVT